MRHRNLTLVIAAAISASLVACGVPPRLSASSYEDLNTSLNATKAALSKRDQPKFDEARRQFNAIYFSSGKDTVLPVGLADWRVVDGMTAGEFVSYVARLKPEEDIGQEATFPSAALASRLLAQYREELALLSQNRNRQIEAGRNTIDQYPIVDFAYVPPMSNVPMEYDKATFIVSLRNDSGYDAYSPTIRIAMLDPKQSVPLLERTFTYPGKREPIDPGQTLNMTFECCSIAIDPLHNSLLKAAPQDTSIEVEVLSVVGHNNQALLNTKAFSLADAQRMKVLELCIKRIETDIAGWVPYAEADQPGGCGDPEQAENLLAMWQEQDVAVPPEFRHLVLAPLAQSTSDAAASPQPATVVTPHPDAAELANPANPAVDDGQETTSPLAQPTTGAGSQAAVGSGQTR